MCNDEKNNVFDRYARLSLMSYTCEKSRLESLVIKIRLFFNVRNCHPRKYIPNNFQPFVNAGTMNLILTLILIIKILLIIGIARSDFSSDDIIENFYWIPKNNRRNIQWEFSIIGKRVTWNVGKILCLSRYGRTKLMNEDIVAVASNSQNSREKNDNKNRSSGLAVLDNPDERLWLARMLSESNYRYDGLWIGGYRKNLQTNWTWIGSDKEEEISIPSQLISNGPEWYKNEDIVQGRSKNCLTFDRNGHNVPILVPTDCQLKRPFLCSRIVRKKIPEIVEGMSVNITGFRYTIFSVKEDEETKINNDSGVRRLNGGGIKWIDARLECRKRGQYLAMVLTNEIAKKIGSIMLKNRPSMESAWLGAWSPDGTDWTWSTSGFVLPTNRTTNSKFPPWLNGHPIASSRNDQFYQKHHRCLILDRHLCPYHFGPVFLDLDCEKKRPFVCQNDIPGRFFNEEIDDETLRNKRVFNVGNKILEFSNERMTWNEGQDYCQKKNGTMASVLDSKTLSLVLDKMGEMYLDHIWIEGKTVETSEGWKWFDENGERLTRKNMGTKIAWCFEDDETALTKAEPHNCLNLDREPHGLPLLYGLPCNFTKQHVLCIFENSTKLIDSRKSLDGSTKSMVEPVNDKKTLSTMMNNIVRVKNNSLKNNTINTTNINSIREKNSSKNNSNVLRFFKDKTIDSTLKKKLKKNTDVKRGIRFSDLDEKTKKFLVASGYNISDTDFILGLELELVELNENTTINGIIESPSNPEECKQC